VKVRNENTQMQLHYVAKGRRGCDIAAGLAVK
jgi:hypothetical protein